MESKFKKLKFIDYFLLSLFDFLLIALALSLFLIQLYSFVGIIAPIVITILLIIIAILRGKLSKDFKEKILTYIMNDNFLNTTYQPKMEDTSYILDSKILDNENLHIKSDDLIKGSYHDINFVSFDSTINKTIGSGFNKEIITVFEGRIIYIEYDKKINTIVREKKEESLYGDVKLPIILSGNDKFDKQFSLYGDKIDIETMNCILELEKMFDGEFCCSFTNKGIYVFKSDFLNVFEIDDTSSINFIRKEFETEIAFIIKAIMNFCIEKEKRKE